MALSSADAQMSSGCGPIFGTARNRRARSLSRFSANTPKAASADTAFRVFAENLDRLRALLVRAVPKIGPQPDDICRAALDSAIVHH